MIETNLREYADGVKEYCQCNDRTMCQRSVLIEGSDFEKAMKAVFQEKVEMCLDCGKIFENKS